MALEQPANGDDHALPLRDIEDWTDVMYINIYGCDKFGGGIYSLATFIGRTSQSARHRDVRL